MTPLRLAPHRQTLVHLLETQAASYGDKPLIGYEGRMLSYAEALASAASMAALLRDAGVVAGDRVAVISRNRLEIVELWMGCAWLGAILIPVNSSLRGVPLQHVLGNSEPRVLVLEREMLAAVRDLDSLPAALERVWLLDDEGAEGLGRLGVESLPQRDGLTPVAPVAAAPGDTSAILYTSGTTGPPKGVCCPQAQMYWWGVNTAKILRLTADDVLYNGLPLFHTNALNTFFQALVTGSTYVIGPHFSASRFWSRLAAADATVVYLLGAMVSILARTPQGGFDREHRVRAALAPATPPDLFEAFAVRFGVELIDGHGMTETNFVIGPRDDQSRPGLMGRVMEGFHARIVDEQDIEVPDGTPGELVMRADEPFAFATGYWKMPEATVSAWRNLWFHSGDRVVREADGYFRFVDRIKDVIRRRGENVSAWEVEQALLSHPDVAAAAAYPVPADIGDDEVMVAVVLREGSGLDAVGLIGHCERRLPYFAVPRYVEIADELPLTENGKIKKFELRELGVLPTTWDREAAGYELER